MTRVLCKTRAVRLGPEGSGNIVSGVIPTRSLGLDTSYAFDSYGRRFTYVVDKRATSHASCQNLEGLTLTSTTPTGKGGLYIEDSAPLANSDLFDGATAGKRRLIV